MARPSMREEIVAAALDQFHTHGFNAAGVKDITDAAGVPKGSFYNHFDSKEALAVVALQRYGTTRGLAELGDKSVPARQRLRAHFEFLRQENEERDYTRGCLIGDFGAEISDHSDVIRDAVKTSLASWGDVLAGAIADGQREGTIRSGIDPKVTARFVLAAWEGTLIAMRAEKSSTTLDDFFEITFGSLLA
ncbi:MAG TPA: TetR family transcriptional regulator C-terminal domain-containing protein [Pseudonocardiaceae bacterium]|nr:TetR family transcriptional regulator C-terminal domain-containing protein [Pseudonocardiaceae bacterium]